MQFDQIGDHLAAIARWTNERVFDSGLLLSGARFWQFGLGFAAALALLTLLEWRRKRQLKLPHKGMDRANKAAPSELRRAIWDSSGSLLSVGLFSGVINILMLTGSIFMLEVYDRVLPSHSLPTLFVLALLVVFLFACQGTMDVIRQRMLNRIGATLDEGLSRRTFAASVQLPLKSATAGDGMQPVRDLDAIRQFLSGLGPTALFDLPWMPLYLGLIYAFHPWLGYTALFGAVLLAIITLLTEFLTRSPARRAGAGAATRSRHMEASVRNAEVLTAMGLTGRMGERWHTTGRQYIVGQTSMADISSGFGALSKVLRLMLQSGMLALGAYLVIAGEATGGIIIASSILTSRALAPVELAIGHWRGFVAARQSWQRLNRLLELIPEADEPLALPRPSRTLSVEGIGVVAPGEQRLIIQEASFMLRAGQGLGIIGPSASGKTSLVRAVVGVWTPVRGKVRLDGAALDQWSKAALGCHIGYLPQDVELFAGTVAENIARFDSEASPEGIIAAATAAGVHEMVVALKDGYETEIGEAGAVLSAGQRQRIALARALYGAPFLVVLDEPNSNLDAEGETALTQAIRGVRERGGIAIVVAHRPSALIAVDMVLAMTNGRQAAFGRKDDVLGKVLGATAPATVPLKVVTEAAKRS